MTPTARDHVAQEISRLAQAGSLDAANGDVLDAWLEGLRREWHAQHQLQRAQHIASSRDEVGRLESEALLARQRADAATADLTRSRRLLDAVEKRILEPAEAQAVERRERRRRPRPTLDPLEGLERRWWHGAMLKVLIVVAALGDVVTFYATLAGFFRQYGSVVLWGLTLALACASVGLMHSAGEALKNLREARGGHGRVVIIFLVLGWLVVGGVAVAFRLLGSSSVSGATSGFGADRSAETAAAAQDALLSAVLLAGLFFASGLLAFYAGFAQHHPRMKAYRSLVAGLPQQAEKVALLQATAERVDRALEHARDGEQRAAQHAEDSIAAADAEIDALKEWVRVSIAGHLGTPEATTGLVVGRADQYATAAPSSPRPLGEDPSPPGDGDVPAPHGPPPPPPSPLGLWAVPVAVAPNGHQPNGHGSSTGQL